MGNLNKEKTITNQESILDYIKMIKEKYELKVTTHSRSKTRYNSINASEKEILSFIQDIYNGKSSILFLKDAKWIDNCCDMDEIFPVTIMALCTRNEEKRYKFSLYTIASSEKMTVFHPTRDYRDIGDNSIVEERMYWIEHE